MNRKTSLDIIFVVALVTIMIGVLGYFYSGPQHTNLITSSSLIGFNSHQAIILIDNGTWSAILPRSNDTYLQFSSSNYNTVVEWAMNQTRGK
jgi:hypothetical protein